MTNCLPRLLGIGTVLLLSASSAWTTSIARSKGDRVNVRSRAGFTGEVITQLKRGQEVKVLATNVLSDPAPDEPAKWFMIELPGDASVWVAADYVEPETHKVTADVLNVRAGPGIEYAAIGRVPNGTVLEPVGSPQEGWLEIAAPEGSIGYVPEPWVTLVEGSGTTPSLASSGPTQGARPTDQWSSGSSAGPPATTPGQPAPSATAPPPPQGTLPPGLGVTGDASDPLTTRTDYAWFEQFVTPSVAPARTGLPPTEDLPAGTSPAPTTPPTEVIGTDLPSDPDADVTHLNMPGTSAGAEVSPEEARWVRREGVVIRPFNFAAPSYYALQARDSGKTVNFLFSTRAEPIDWSEYRGKVVIVSGREYLDRRTYWRGIPVLDVEEIEAVR